MLSYVLGYDVFQKQYSLRPLHNPLHIIDGSYVRVPFIVREWYRPFVSIQSDQISVLVCLYTDVTGVPVDCLISSLQTHYVYMWR